MEPKIRVDRRRNGRCLHHCLLHLGPRGVRAPAGLSFARMRAVGYRDAVTARLVTGPKSL